MLSPEDLAALEAVFDQNGTPAACMSRASRIIARRTAAAT
jgi:hypothetical protein